MLLVTLYVYAKNVYELSSQHRDTRFLVAKFCLAGFFCATICTSEEKYGEVSSMKRKRRFTIFAFVSMSSKNSCTLSFAHTLNILLKSSRFFASSVGLCHFKVCNVYIDDACFI